MNRKLLYGISCNMIRIGKIFFFYCLYIMMQSNIKLTIHLKPLHIKLDYVFVLTNWAFFPVLIWLGLWTFQLGFWNKARFLRKKKTYLISCKKKTNSVLNLRQKSYFHEIEVFWEGHKIEQTFSFFELHNFR